MQVLLTLTFEEGWDEEIAAALFELVPWGWEEKKRGTKTKILIYCPDPVRTETISLKLQSMFPGLNTAISQAEEKDWMQDWRKFFQPLYIEDKFLILPSWEKPENLNKDLLPLYIYPEMAFGTGHHQTTRICLQGLSLLHRDALLSPSDKFLDIGTGSGILSLACAGLGLKGLALDIDPVAVKNAQYNRKINKQEHGFCLLAGDLNCIKMNSKYSLVMANILADPLKKMAKTVSRLSSPGAFLILSGILKTQMQDIFKTYLQIGWQQFCILQEGEWVGLIMQKNKD